MESLNRTESFGFITSKENSVLGEFVRAACYGVTGSMVLINITIASAFLVQKIRRGLRLNPSCLLVLNLIFADAFLGTVLFLLTGRLGIVPQYCGIWSGVTYLATIGSRIALINVVLDRFIAIVYSLHYRGWMTKTRSKGMLVCGWSLPVAGLVYGIALNDWNPGPARRCSDIHNISMFLRYVWVPSLIIFNLSVIIIQCALYLHLRRQDARKATSYSHKVARILFWIVTPTCVALLSYDIMVVVIVPRVNWILRSVYSVLLIFVLFSFLLNPVVYSYTTDHIKKPVSDLCKDIKVWLCPSREPTSCAPSVFVIEPRYLIPTHPRRFSV